eukprot:6476759-Amphidinium_carterae.1
MPGAYSDACCSNTIGQWRHATFAGGRSNTLMPVDIRALYPLTNVIRKECHMQRGHPVVFFNV